MELEFKSLKELYDRVKPALYSKIKEMNRLGISIVSEVDVWNYLVDNSWRSRNDLLLHEVINDILNVNNYDVYDYVMKKLDKMKVEEKVKLNTEE